MSLCHRTWRSTFALLVFYQFIIGVERSERLCGCVYLRWQMEEVLARCLQAKSFFVERSGAAATSAANADPFVCARSPIFIFKCCVRVKFVGIYMLFYYFCLGSRYALRVSCRVVSCTVFRACPNAATGQCK